MDKSARTSATTRFAEFRAKTDAALAAAVNQLADTRKREWVDHRSRATYECLNDSNRFATVVVKHSDRPRSIEASRDGGDARIYLPKRFVTVEPESIDNFLLVIAPKWLSELIRKDGGPNLMGVIPPLSSGRNWTADDQKHWDALERICFKLNARINSPKSAKHNPMPYGWTA